MTTVSPTHFGSAPVLPFAILGPDGSTPQGRPYPRLSVAELRRGALILCLFPLAEAPGEPGSVKRPALVIESRRDGEGRLFVTAACGGGEPPRCGDHAVRVSGPEVVARCGLDHETWFDLDGVAEFPATDAYLARGAKGSPVLGALGPSTRDQLEEIERRLRPARGSIPRATPSGPVATRRTVEIVRRRSRLSAAASARKDQADRDRRRRK